MPEESAPPNPAELKRRSFEDGNRRDVNAAISNYGPQSRAVAVRLAEVSG